MNLLKKRHLILLACGMVLAVIIFFNFNQAERLKAFRQETESLGNQINDLNSRLQGMRLESARLKDQLPEQLAVIPASIRTGYEDSEVRLAEFLDYLSEIQKKVGFSFTIDERPRYVKEPVALYQTDFTFLFTFDRLAQVNSFFSLILEQDMFPLKVSYIDIRRESSKKETCMLKASLLIPARMQPAGSSEFDEIINNSSERIPAGASHGIHAEEQPGPAESARNIFLWPEETSSLSQEK